MTASEISALLSQRAGEIASFLLPGGQKRGNDWCTGSVQGDKGKSCKVCITGSKAGVWCDFADAGKSGDLLDLWCEVRNIGIKDAMAEARQYLGIVDITPIDNERRKPRKIEVKAQKIAGSDVHRWLKERGLSDETIAKYGIRQENGAAVFPYTWDGHTVMAKYRKPWTKDIWTNKDPTPVLFGWQAIPPNAREVVLTEGEIDCMTYAEFQIPALSVPFGGGDGKKQAWIDNEYPRLAHFDRIYVSMDMDDAGKTAMEEIVERLGRERCFVVELPHKDANECYLNALDLRDYVKTAKTLDPKSLKNAEIYYQDAMDIIHGVENDEPGIELPWPKAANRFRLRPGEITIWTGINGHGKSRALTQIAVHGGVQNTRWCIASMETRPKRLMADIVMQTTGVDRPAHDYARKVFNWYSGWLWLFTRTGTNKANEILEVFRYARKRYGIDHFVVDSLAKCGIAEDDYNGQKAFIDQLGDLARDTDCHVHLVAHSRKGESESDSPGKLDVKGTGAITDMADNVVTVWRNKPKEEKLRKIDPNAEDIPSDLQKYAAKPDAFMTIHKQRNFDWEGQIALWYRPDVHQFVEYDGARPVNYYDNATKWNYEEVEI